MVDTNGIGFGLKELDAREEFPLSTGFGQQGWVASTRVEGNKQTYK